MVAGLTVLNSFTWEHSLDNASSSLEGNTPSPQDANNLRAEYAQSDYNLPVSNVTSLVYELPYGRGRRFGRDVNGFVDAVAGGWQVSAINTAQAGTPFDLSYTPNSAQLASTQITANYRGVNLYRPNRVPGVPLTLGRSIQQANTGYYQYINYAALSLPTIRNTAGVLQAPFGNLGRNPARTPELNEMDLDVNKRFSTPIESLKIEFRSERDAGCQPHLRRHHLQYLYAACGAVRTEAGLLERLRFLNAARMCGPPLFVPGLCLLPK